MNQKTKGYDTMEIIPRKNKANTAILNFSNCFVPW